jgi:hypothetical protein
LEATVRKKNGRIEASLEKKSTAGWDATHRAIGLKTAQENNDKYEQRVTVFKVERCGSSLLTSRRKMNVKRYC